MRHLALAAAVLCAATFALAPARAQTAQTHDRFGPKEQNGQCRLFNGNSNGLAYNYWGACPKKEAAATSSTHTAKTAAHTKKKHG
jgi:hypothetical protein